MNEQAKPSFAEQLIQSDPPNVPLAENYQNQIQALVECHISMPLRWVCGVSTAILLGASVFVGLRRLPVELPLLFSLRLVGIAAMLAFAAALAYMAIRGHYNRKTSARVPTVVASLACGFMAVILLEWGWASDDGVTRGRLIVAGTILLFLLAFGILLTVLEDYHVKTEEKLLRMECRMADLAEKLKHQRT